MRHLKHGARLGVTPSHRRAMFRNMVTSLLKFERITTTLAKAKELRRVGDNMITLGKAGTLSSRRKAAAYIKDPELVKKLFDPLAKRYVDRNGGYTRIYKVGVRKGDSSKMAIIELVDRDLSAAPKVKPKKKSVEE